MTKTTPEPTDEFGLVARHLAPLAAAERGALGLLDDAAVLRFGSDRDLVVTTDTLVADVHFLGDDPFETVAAKALAVNLSDLASMGARPLAYTVAVAVPRHLDGSGRDAWFAALASGLKAMQTACDVTLIGGDTVATPGPATLTITALGSVTRDRALLRSGAQPGDRILVSGTIGDAALGLRVLRNQLSELGPTHSRHLVDRYRRPTPRLTLGVRLAGLAHAAADVSDGLVADLGRICSASKVEADVDVERLPLSAAARRAIDGDPELIGTVVTGGDDYELVFTAPETAMAEVAVQAAAVEVPVATIGVIRKPSAARQPVRLCRSDGSQMDITDDGYRHF